jgi:deoxyribose-phosphate aldolase
MPEQMLSCHDIAQMIDISAVQAPHGEHEIRKLVDITRQFGFGSVHVLYLASILEYV